MALGAYSIVRFSDDLSDQRVNLGVLLWHPHDGFRFQCSHAIDRAKSVDPRVRVSPLRQQLERVPDGLDPEAGLDELRRLSQTFRHGLEVSAPYPAEFTDIDETLATLFEQLVSPIPEIRRAGSQKQFESNLRTSLEAKLKQLAPNARLRDIGQRRVNGISVNVGLRTEGDRVKALWRGLSFQSVTRPDEQLARAKATALDVSIIRSKLATFHDDRHFVAVQPPKPQSRAADDLDQSLKWLNREADDVFIVGPRQGLSSALENELGKLFPRRARFRPR